MASTACSREPQFEYDEARWHFFIRVSTFSKQVLRAIVAGDVALSLFHVVPERSTWSLKDGGSYASAISGYISVFFPLTFNFFPETVFRKWEFSTKIQRDLDWCACISPAGTRGEKRIIHVAVCYTPIVSSKHRQLTSSQTVKFEMNSVSNR